MPEFLRIELNTQISTAAKTNWFTISEPAHLFEVRWHAAASTTPKDAPLQVWIDGSRYSAVDDRNNDVRIGVCSGVEPRPRGTSTLNLMNLIDKSTTGFGSLG
jgi:hypothetical protein